MKWAEAVGIGVARPGSASAALGNAVVLRMNNMDALQVREASADTNGPGLHRWPRANIGLCATCCTPFRRAARGNSVARIADQWLARPKQQHQEDTNHAKDRERRLVQHDLGDIIPEPGGKAFDPVPKRLLAGLVDVIPELAKPRESQALIGDPA